MAIWNAGHRQQVDYEHRTLVTNSQAAIPIGKPMGTWRVLVHALLLSFLVMIGTGCGDNSKNTNMGSVMNNDLNGLKKLIHLPADVKRVEWQSGKLGTHGDDWWLAAVLEVEIEKIPDFLQGAGTKEVFEPPPGLQLMSSFAALKTLSEGQPIQSTQIRLITETYGVDSYLNSPLLTGKAIRLSENQVLVVLWTN